MQSLSRIVKPKAEVADINQEIKQMRRAIKSHSRCIIHPRTMRWIQYWDAASFLCLLFTATVTPVEVTLLTSHSFSQLLNQPRHLALFVLNRAIDLFFAVSTQPRAHSHRAHKGLTHTRAYCTGLTHTRAHCTRHGTLP